ncbi:hypothetical protein GJ496_005489 [Pomphorhynchus laevis]|nr:hypothetical protein GJ496_005489 [Pomphorhynchus laevis]
MQLELGKGIIPEDLSEPYATRSVVKMSCLANDYRPTDSSRLSDKTKGPNDEGLINPYLQFNFEHFQSMASTWQSGMLRSQCESSKNTDKHNQAESSIHVDQVKGCIDQLTDQLVSFDNENCSG